MLRFLLKSKILKSQLTIGAGVVHCDIKQANVYLRVVHRLKSYHLVVSDCGKQNPVVLGRPSVEPALRDMVQERFHCAGDLARPIWPVGLLELQNVYYVAQEA